MASLRVILAQLNVTVGDLSGNLERVREAVRDAQAWRADLVVLPELVLTGYPPEDLLLKPQFVEANLAALEALVPGVRGLTAVVGYVDRGRDRRLANAAAVIRDGRVIATYRKQCLPNYGVFDERRYFAPGGRAVCFTLGGVPIGVTICEDLWVGTPLRALDAAGCRLVLNLSASPYHRGKAAERERLFARRVREHGMALAYCNLSGGQDELVFDGASAVFDSRGRLLGRAAQFKEDRLVVDLPGPALGSRRVRLLRALPERPPAPVKRTPLAQGEQEVYDALTLGVRDYVRKNAFSSVVIGLSGGIDSALTACLAADALGPERVVGAMMPSRFSSSGTREDARRLADRLGIRSLVMPIEGVVRAYVNTLRPVAGALEDPAPGAAIAEQNIQARIRGNLLMALSNRYGWLVLTTGNKSEIATGYTTLYGDMAGGFAVIKDVPKTLVYRLARYRNRRGPGRPIPARVLRRAPSAELARGQRDRDTLPPYPVLDRILTAYVEEDRSLRDILRAGLAPRHTAARVIRMVDRSEYKRRQGPPGIKITPKAFGKDRRMPITNRWLPE
ncbi:MAG TPA: NAD+ synthase [bacterium]